MGVRNFRVEILQTTKLDKYLYMNMLRVKKIKKKITLKRGIDVLHSIEKFFISLQIQCTHMLIKELSDTIYSQFTQVP